MSKTLTIIQSLGIHLGTPKNKMYQCPFPDHNDKTASFSLDDHKGKYGAYHCFGCSHKGKQGGNMIDFIERYTGCSSEDAIKYYLNATGEGKTYTKFETKQEFLKSLPVLKRAFKQSVPLEEATAYLKSRGIKKLPNGVLRYLNNEFYDNESKTLITKGSIVSPIYNEDNILISLQSINPENKKQFDKKGEPYKEKQFLKNHSPKNGFTRLIIDNNSDVMILCEALIDGLSINQVGYNAICCYNAANLVNVAFTLRHELRKNAFIFADNDNLLGNKHRNEGLEKALDAAIILGGFAEEGDLKAPKTKKTIYSGAKRCIVSWEEKDANDVLCSVNGFKKLKALITSNINSNYLKNTLNGLLESKRLKLYLEQLNKCYIAYLDNIKLEDNKPANLATNLYTILVAKNIVARAYSDKEFNDNIKVIKQFCIENSNSYYAENYFPGRDYLSIQKQRNKEYLNVYEQSGLITKVKEYEEQEGDAKIFEALETYLLNLTNNEPEGYAFLIQLLAYKLQKPEIRHDYAVICFDKGGTGKSTFAKIMREILGENVSVSISQDNLQSQWNDYLKNKLMVFGEEVVGIAEKHNTSNNLKSVITDRELHVSERHKSNTYYNNFITLFLFSNDPEPIRITSDDRRYIVFEPIQSSEAIFDILHKDLKRTALVLAKYLTKIPLTERLKQYKNNSRQKLIGVSKNYIETLVDELSKNPREVLKNAQGKNKTNNKIPILEVQEFANEDYKPVQSQSIGTYVAEIKHKDGKDYLYMNGLLFYDLAKVLYEIKSNQRKVYQLADASPLFTYHKSPVMVDGKQVRCVSIKLSD